MKNRVFEEQKQRVKIILREMRRMFPRLETSLSHKNPWELLVATILSAQCTDKKVNEVTQMLFKKYRLLNDYIKANSKEFERDIYQTGFYRSKTKFILKSAHMLKERFGGKVPQTMSELVQLPGVARKTANVVLGNAYGVAEGIAVDTHVKRMARKFGLTSHIDPVKIEKDLMQIVPKKDWMIFSHALIEFGRKVCPARKHNCSNHPLGNLLP